MKLCLKIFLAPVVAALAVLVWLSGLGLRCSAWVFGIAGSVFGVLGLAVLLLDNTANGIIVLVFAFLISPVGVPMLGAWLLGQLQRLRYFILDTIYE